MPTFQEAIDLVRGKAGLYPELKSPPLYTSRGVDQIKLFVDIDPEERAGQAGIAAHARR